MGMPNRQRTAYSVPPGWAEAGSKWWHPAPPGAAKGRFPKMGGGGALLVYSWAWCVGLVVGGGCFSAAVGRVCGALWSCGLGRCVLRLCGTNCLVAVRDCTALLPCVATLLCGRVGLNRLATVWDHVALRCVAAVRDCTILWQCGTALYRGSEGLHCSVAVRDCTALWRCGTALRRGCVGLNCDVDVRDRTAWWQCGAELHCRSVGQHCIVPERGCTASWLCGTVALWRCGTALRCGLRDCFALRLRGTALLCGSVGLHSIAAVRG